MLKIIGMQPFCKLTYGTTLVHGFLVRFWRYVNCYLLTFNATFYQVLLSGVWVPYIMGSGS